MHVKKENGKIVYLLRGAGEGAGAGAGAGTGAGAGAGARDVGWLLVVVVVVVLGGLVVVRLGATDFADMAEPTKINKCRKHSSSINCTSNPQVKQHKKDKCKN